MKNTAVDFKLKNVTLLTQPVIPTLNGVFPYPQHLLNTKIKKKNTHGNF